jgi:hypothetical protein
MIHSDYSSLNTRGYMRIEFFGFGIFDFFFMANDRGHSFINGNAWA